LTHKFIKETLIILFASLTFLTIESANIFYFTIIVLFFFCLFLLFSFSYIK